MRNRPLHLTLAVSFAFAGSVQAATFLIDFGSPKPEFVTASSGWNNVNPATTSISLVEATGQPSPVRLTIDSPFNTSGQGNTSGTTTPGGGAQNYAATATRDSLFGNVALFGGQVKRSPVITFSGLDPAQLYTFTFFASRTGNPVHDRSTDYVITNGAVTDVKSLNAQDNHLNVAVSEPMPPSPGGTLTLSLVPARSNSTAEGFTYLGVLEIEGAPAPKSGAQEKIKAHAR